MSLVGNLVDLPLTDIFQIVSLSKRTGILNIVHESDKASITFLNGNVIKTSSTRNKRTLGSLLKEKGLITEKNEASVLALQKSTGDPFGTILVRENIVSRERMEKAVSKHIQDIVVELLSWEEGHFEFELLSSPKEMLPMDGTELILQEGLETQHLIIEGLRRLDEERHNNQQVKKEAKKEGVKNLGFSSLIEDSPVSLAGQGPEATAVDSSGHPEGLWESIHDEIESGEVATPLPAEEESHELNFLEQLAMEVGEDFVPEQEGSEQQAEISSLKSMVEELKGPSSLSEVLLLILRYAVEFMNRSALFVVNGGEIRGFGQFGLDTEGQNANERIRNTLVPEESDSILSTAVIMKSKIQKPLDSNNRWDGYLQERLGGGPAKESIVIPVINNNRAIALLYGDNGPEGETIGDIEALEIFMIQAGFVLDRSQLESKLQDMQGH
jgi:hypothetical protein